MNRRGQIVLRTSAEENLGVKPGDVLVVGHTHGGRIVLEKRCSPRRGTPRKKSYLTPSPLSPTTLERIYSRPDPDWDKVEAEAVALSRRALAGRRLNEL